MPYHWSTNSNAMYRKHSSASGRKVQRCSCYTYVYEHVGSSSSLLKERRALPCRHTRRRRRRRRRRQRRRNHRPSYSYKEGKGNASSGCREEIDTCALLFQTKKNLKKNKKEVQLDTRFRSDSIERENAFFVVVEFDYPPLNFWPT